MNSLVKVDDRDCLSVGQLAGLGLACVDASTVRPPAELSKWLAAPTRSSTGRLRHGSGLRLKRPDQSERVA